MEHAATPEKSSKLFDAIRNGTYEEFLKMLETEDVNQLSDEDTTPLMELMYARSAPDREQKLQALLSHTAIEIDMVNSQGLTALSVATVCERRFVAPLLEADANPNVMTLVRLTGGMKQSSINANQWRRVSLLAAALNNYDTDTFELLQSYGADVNIVGDMDISPLSLAARANNVGAMIYLVEQAGAELNVLPTNWQEYTSNPQKVCAVSLRKALKHGSLDALDYLLNKGVNVPAIIYRSAGQYATPMTYLLSQPVWGIKRRIYENAARRLLRWMRLQNNIAIKRGEQPKYDFQATDTQSRTALHYAAEGYSVSLCRRLITTPSIIHQPDNHGMTPFGIVVRRGALDILEEFLKQGANPNEGIHFVPQHAYNSFSKIKVHKEPAIFYAMRHKNEAMAILLIKAGANLLFRDSENKRPEDYLDDCFSDKFKHFIRGVTKMQEKKFLHVERNDLAQKYFKSRAERTKQ